MKEEQSFIFLPQFVYSNFVALPFTKRFVIQFHLKGIFDMLQYLIIGWFL